MCEARDDGHTNGGTTGGGDVNSIQSLFKFLSAIPTDLRKSDTIRVNSGNNRIFVTITKKFHTRNNFLRYKVIPLNEVKEMTIQPSDIDSLLPDPYEVSTSLTDVGSSFLASIISREEDDTVTEARRLTLY